MPHGFMRFVVGVLTFAFTVTSASSLFGQNQAAPSRPACVECDRQSRKVFEALQAWRRANDGQYPPSLVAMVDAGLLDRESIICPDERSELHGASSAHPLAPSQGEGSDPIGAYTYELGAFVLPNTTDYMGEAIPSARVKAELLRRSLWQQVPIIRCSAHNSEVTPPLDEFNTSFRNLTATGEHYWSKGYWEWEWPDVPETCRGPLVTKGLRGPPFGRQKGPANPNEIDLRSYYNSCGEKPWWWGFSYLDQNHKTHAPDLSTLLTPDLPKEASLGGCSFWLDGLIQLQGKLVPETSPPSGFTKRQIFPWNTRPVLLNKRIQSATVLLGCVWPDQEGNEVGSLAWKYADGPPARSPFYYGRMLRQFWKLGDHSDSLPVPAFQSTTEYGARIRVYSVVCQNDHAEKVVESLTVEGNETSPAGLFVLAITVDSR